MEAPATRPGRLGPEDGLLLAAVLLLPWAFGGVEVWAFRGAGFLLAAGAAVALVRGGGSAWPLGPGRRLWLLPAFLLAAWAGLQLVPLPPATLAAVSPTAHRILEERWPDPATAGEAAGLALLEARALRAAPPADVPPPEEAPVVELPGDPFPCAGAWRPISLYPAATAERLCWYLALLLGFLALRGRVADRGRYRVYRGAIFLGSGLLAAFALVQSQTWNGAFYWVRPLLYEAAPLGPYVNPTHFAGLMELVVPWMVGAAWHRFRRRGRAALREASALGPAVGAIVCTAAAFASASKFAGLILATALVALVLAAARSRRTRLVLGLTAGAGVAAAAVLLVGSGFGERFAYHLARTDAASPLGARWVTWSWSRAMLSDFFVTGSGFGSFRQVFLAYMPPGQQARWGQAHNDYLELLLTGGIVALVLTAWLAWGFAARASRRLRGADGWHLSRVGAALGVGSLALHAAVDFNHQIPANALLFVAVAAMLVPGTSGGTSASAPGLPFRRRLPAAIVALALVAGFGYRAATGLVGGLAFARAEILVDDEAFDEALPLLRLGVRMVPTLHYTRLAAETAVDRWEQQAAAGGPPSADHRLLAEAAGRYRDCLCLSPASRLTWEGLADVYEDLEWVARERRAEAGELPDHGRWARVGRSGRIALGMLQLAVGYAPNWFRPHDRLAVLLWRFGLWEESAEAVAGSARVLPLYWRHTFSEEPESPDWMRDVFAATSWEMLGRTPVHPTDQLIDLGKLERRRRDPERAVAAFERVLDDGRASAVDLAEVDYHLGLALIASGRFDDGSRRLRRAAEHPTYRIPALESLARESERTGRLEDALEELRSLRWERPDELRYCLEYARVARRLARWPETMEALAWAKISHPDDPEPWVATVLAEVDRGELLRARAELAELESRFSDHARIAELRRAIAIGER